MHGVGTRGKGLAGAAAVGRVAGLLAVHHVGGDGEHRLGGHGIAVGVQLAKLVHEVGYQRLGDFVHAGVVVAVAGELALGLEVDDEAFLVADALDLGVLDGGQGVCSHGKAGDTGSHGAENLRVMQSHLDALIAVLVMHVVDDVQGINVGLGEPILHVVEQLHYLVILKVFTLVARGGRGHLLALHFVHTAVQGVEQSLGQVGAGAEELHLLADAHGGHTAGNAVVIAPVRAHQVVVLILHRGGFDGNLGAVLLEAFGQGGGPQHGQVRLGSRPQVVQGLQHTEGAAGHQRAAVFAHTADGFGYPGGVAGEQAVVLGGTDETHHAQLHHELVHELLDFGFRDGAGGQVALEVDVEEGGYTAQGHSGAVLFLHCGQVAQVGPLHSLAGVGGGAAQVAAIALAHFCQFGQGADLLVELFAQADGGIGHGTGFAVLQVLAAGGDELVRAVQGHAAVVADDTAAAVGIGQTGDDAGGAGSADVAGVGIEHAFIVRLADAAEEFGGVRAHLQAVGFQSLLSHAQTTEGHESALQRGIGLQTDNLLAGLVDVTGSVGNDGGYNLGVGAKQTAGVNFLLHQVLHLVPQGDGVLRRAGQEVALAGVGGVVLLDEVADVDGIGPFARFKALPRIEAGTFLSACGVCHKNTFWFGVVVLPGGSASRLSTISGILLSADREVKIHSGVIYLFLSKTSQTLSFLVSLFYHDTGNSQVE